MRAPATYAWCVKSGERKRERTRVTIVAERGHDTGGKKKKREEKEIGKGSVQSRLHETDGQTDEPGYDDCP